MGFLGDVRRQVPQVEGMSDFINWISWFSYQMVKDYEVLDTISSGGGVGGGL